MQRQAFEIAACRIRILRPHHDKLTIEYNLQCRNGKKGDTFVYDLVGTWRQDNRNSEMDHLYKQLVEKRIFQTAQSDRPSAIRLLEQPSSEA